MKLTFSIGGAMALAVALLMLVVAPGASAAPGQALTSSSCYDNGHNIKFMGTSYNEYQCTTYKTGYTYDDQTRTGELYAGSNWMACQWNFKGYSNPPVGSARNTWWMWTKGDKVLKFPYAEGWGWFPATYVSQGANNSAVPGVAKCAGPGSTTPPVTTNP